MASKCFSLSGLAISAIVFIVALIFMIITTSRSAAYVDVITSTDTVTDYTNVATRATFDSSNLKNATSVVLNLENKGKWASIPGDFDTLYELDVNIQLFTSNNDFSGGPTVESNGAVAVSIHPTVEWTDISASETEYRCTGCMMKTVKATPVYTVPEDEETALKQDIVETLNYGALSTWYKLQNAPIYKKSWQVWTQVMNKMYTQSFQDYYYAFFCFNSVDASDSTYYNFADQASVESMLENLSQEPFTVQQAATIYSDPQFGMSSYKALTYWVAAALQARTQFTQSGAGSEQWLVIQEHFAALQTPIIISDTQLYEIVSAGSHMYEQIHAIEVRLVDNSSKTKYTGLSDPINANPLAMVQWSQKTLLGAQLDFWLSGSNDPLQPSFQDITSMKDLGMNFNVPPEFTQAGAITVDQGLAMSWNGAYQPATKSLIYPINMYTEWFDYLTTGTFSELDTDQTNLFIDWFTEQLTYNGEQAQGTFIAKSIESASSFLVTNFLAESAARSFGYQINFISDPVLDCSHFLTPVLGADTELYCESWSFSSLTNIRMFVDGAMKGTEVTGLTSAQTATLFATTTTSPTTTDIATGTFGDVLLYINQLSSTTWGCEGSFSTPVVECTAAEVAPVQWGSSYMTRNVIFSSLTSSNGFLKSAYSICDWTGTPLPACGDFPPEYGAYQNTPYTFDTQYLNQEQSIKVLDTSYSWFGLQNIYNGMLIFRDYEIAKKDWVSPSQYWYDTMAFYDMTEDELKRLMKFLEWQSIEWLTGGATSKLSKWDLVTGFETDFTTLINTGDLREGNIYVDSEVTPFLNHWMGPTYNRAITMLQGERTTGSDPDVEENAVFWPQDAGAVREIDSDGAYIWLNQWLYTGVENDNNGFEQVKWYNEAVGVTYLYDINAPITGICDLKVPIINSPNMSSQSLVRGFNLQTFAQYNQIFSFTTDYCLQGNILGGTCYQYETTNNYKQYTAPGNINYSTDALNMPVTVVNSASQQEIDQAQGWTTLFSNTFKLQLEGGHRFYSDSTNDQNPIIGTVQSQIVVYQEAYMNSVLPLNGTTAWPTGEHQETVKTNVDVPRASGAKVGISALAILTFVGLLMIGIFAKLYCEPDNAANKVAYPNTNDDGMADKLVNPSGEPSDPQL